MTTAYGGFATTVRDIVAEARAQQITFLAASIAYYAFVSIIPALLLAVAAASFFGGEALAAEVQAALQGSLSPAAAEIVGDVIRDRSGRGGATVVGSTVLLWSTLKVFRGLDEAFSRVYDTHDDDSFVETVVDAVTVLAIIGAAVGAIVAVEALLSTFAWVPFAGLVASVVLLFSLLPVFLPLYYVFPDAGVSLREALPGALVATVGWTVLQAGFQAYFEQAGQFAVYGVLGGALLLVTLLYFGGILLLLGVVVNVVLARRKSFRKTKDAADAKKRQQEDRGDHMTDDTDQSAPDILQLRDDLRQVQSELEDFERDVDERTVEKPQLESELKQYVRSRMRRGHARGWGPYLVLLYGTLMTLGAFRWLDGGWAIAGMVVVWLSTLGLYALMLLVGFGVNALGVPGRVVGRVEDWRS
ncbi:YihY/virulence factor BrkB family protein [Halomicrococcus sp. NG-SE-24]|uniref:YihY/virulence factor BrkB family protein n=1 Tax=Halomicrococcus sp. NG-SE-24 TaxID=3436928 RepID=UPI003D96491A